jgi:hypothetical protein
MNPPPRRPAAVDNPLPCSSTVGAGFEAVGALLAGRVRVAGAGRRGATAGEGDDGVRAVADAVEAGLEPEEGGGES